MVSTETYVDFTEDIPDIYVDKAVKFHDINVIVAFSPSLIAQAFAAMIERGLPFDIEDYYVRLIRDRMHSRAEDLDFINDRMK